MSKVAKGFKKIKYKFMRLIFFIIKPFIKIKKNVFVFNNFFGKGFNDNPAFIAEQVHNLNKDIKIYWVCINKSIKLPDYVHPLLLDTLKELVTLAKAKVRVSNIRNYFTVKVKKGQVYVQTWHGSNGLKKVEGAIEDKLDPNYVKDAKYDGSVASAIVSCSKEADERYQKYFYLGPQCEILKFGFPRRDFVINNKDNKELKDNIRNKAGLSSDDFVIVYAPTFRDDGDTRVFLYDYQKLLDSFEKRLNKKCKLVIKLHPIDADKDIGIKYDERVINGNKFNSINDLILIGDLLITDYSSTYYEFMLMCTPVILYFPDYDKYNEARGSGEIIKKLPFTKVYSEKELLSLASSFNYQDNKKIVTDYYNQLDIYDDGKASINIAKWILDKAGY